MNNEWREKLRTAIDARFDETELQNLVFDLGENYEEITGKNKSDKVRELIEKFERKEKILDLINKCKERRPDPEVIVTWEEAAREYEASKKNKLPLIESFHPSRGGLNPQTIGIAVIVILLLSIAAYLLFRPVPQETTSPPATEPPTTHTTPETAVTTVPVAMDTTEATAVVATEVVATEVVATEVLPTPTDEPTPEPTAAPLVEASAQTEPTIAYPNGERLELAYDPNSFYLYNPSADRIRVRDISFEALDSAGRPLRFNMAGDRWTQFATFLEGYACYAIEPSGVGGSYLRPLYCRDYNAIVAPAINSVEIFWIERSEAVEFRVLWAGQEIARCPLGTNTCIVFVPTP